MNPQTFTKSINTITLPLSSLLLMGLGILWAFGQASNRAPIVSNARAQQRAGTRLVDIT